jgi:hypothetical protein
MIILSPSWKRGDICNSHNYFKDLKYVVCESQVESYEKYDLPILKCPDSAQGNVSRVRNWILDYAKDEDLLIVDDDLKSLSRYEGNNLHKMDSEEASNFIEYGFELAKEFGVKMWGVNIIQDKGAYREYTPFSFKNVILGPFGGFLNCDIRYDENLPLKEDYDYSLQCLNKYRKILRINFVHYNCDQHTNLGGCAEYRTVQAEQDQFVALRKKWGKEIVKKDDNKRVTNRKRQVSYDINPIVKVPIGGV